MIAQEYSHTSNPALSTAIYVLFEGTDMGPYFQGVYTSLTLAQEAATKIGEISGRCGKWNQVDETNWQARRHDRMSGFTITQMYLDTDPRWMP